MPDPDTNVFLGTTIVIENKQSICDGLQWPWTDASHTGTPCLHKGTFAWGQGNFHAADYRDPTEMPNDDDPHFLTTGR